jgi:hypothetical protein
LHQFENRERIWALGTKYLATFVHNWFIQNWAEFWEDLKLSQSWLGIVLNKTGKSSSLPQNRPGPRGSEIDRIWKQFSGLRTHLSESHPRKDDESSCNVAAKSQIHDLDLE